MGLSASRAGCRDTTRDSVNRLLASKVRAGPAGESPSLGIISTRAWRSPQWLLTGINCRRNYLGSSPANRKNPNLRGVGAAGQRTLHPAPVGRLEIAARPTRRTARSEVFIQTAAKSGPNSAAESAAEQAAWGHLCPGAIGRRTARARVGSS